MNYIFQLSHIQYFKRMDPIWFEKGRIVTDAPTYTPKVVDLDPDIARWFPGLKR